MTSIRTVILATLAGVGGFLLLPVVWGAIFGALGVSIIDFFGVQAAITAFSFAGRSVGIIAIIGGLVGVMLVVER